jgi:hypothetical protein
MTSPPQPKIVEAQQFIVRDENGKIRATLGAVNSKDSALLALHDEAGVARVDLEVLPDGYPSFSFSRGDGNPWFVLRRTNSQTTVLALNRGDATHGVVVIVPDVGDIKIGLTRGDGEETWLQGGIEPGDFGV